MSNEQRNLITSNTAQDQSSQKHNDLNSDDWWVLCPCCGSSLNCPCTGEERDSCWQHYVDDDTTDIEPVGDDGYPLDMDDETKAWLRTNR